MGIATAIIGGALIGAGASAYSASKASSTAKATNAANQRAITNTQTQNNALYAPYVDRGNQAGAAANAFLGLGGQQAQDEAFANWRNSTGYQFNLKGGTDAIAAGAATKGSLNSGATLKALTRFGTDVANTYGQQYLGNLQTQQGVGLQAAGGNASSNTNALGLAVGSNNQAAQGQYGAYGMFAQGMNDLGANLAGAYAYQNAMNPRRYASSYGGNG